jgi:pyruvate formate lyase activating enzyme
MVAETKSPETNCLVIDISRGTTHDGPGLRTTVFFKGCPLACAWCQNPEGIKAGQEIWWEERKCIRCLECVAACPNGALREEESGIVRDRALCELCGACVEACPSLAMAYTGQEWSLEGLVKEALKDKEYYRAFGGGVTVSGGEPLRQHDFVGEFLGRMQAEGIHTALDTCGLASQEALDAVLPFADMVLFDIKLLDPEQHRRYTGQSNQIILRNLERIAEAVRASRRDGGHAKRLWIRTPLIPGTTAGEENLAAIGAYIHERLDDAVERWELCAFNSACKSKYKKMGQTWIYEDVPLMRQDEIERVRAAALSGGFDAGRLVVSGLVAKGEA